MLYFKGILSFEFYEVTVEFFQKLSAYILGDDLLLRFAYLSYTSLCFKGRYFLLNGFI